MNLRSKNRLNGRLLVMCLVALSPWSLGCTELEVDKAKRESIENQLSQTVKRYTETKEKSDTKLKNLKEAIESEPDEEKKATATKAYEMAKESIDVSEAAAKTSMQQLWKTATEMGSKVEKPEAIK